MCYSRGSSEPGSARLGCPKGGLRPAACLRQLPFKATNARFSHIKGRLPAGRENEGLRRCRGLLGLDQASVARRLLAPTMARQPIKTRG